jgi:hypothetical protein
MTREFLVPAGIPTRPCSPGNRSSNNNFFKYFINFINTEKSFEKRLQLTCFALVAPEKKFDVVPADLEPILVYFMENLVKNKH